MTRGSEFAIINVAMGVAETEVAIIICLNRTIMRFFDRENEIAYLRLERARQNRGARMTVVSGRRRIGKTQLIKRAMEDEPYLYFLVTRRSEADQCQDYLERVREALGISVYGQGMRFGQLFKILMQESLKRPFTLVIDELQEFMFVEPGIFGEIQEHWDAYHAESKMNLIVCGSVNTLMNKLFFEDGQPLYGRSTSHMKLKPFSLPVRTSILREYNPVATSEDVLALWTFTGGGARYVEELMDRGDVTKERMIDGIMREHSYFFDEGKGVLVQEFGKEYGTYFSIMSALARGVTTRNEIEQIVGMSIGGHLRRRIPLCRNANRFSRRTSTSRAVIGSRTTSSRFGSASSSSTPT